MPEYKVLLRSVVRLQLKRERKVRIYNNCMDVYRGFYVIHLLQLAIKAKYDSALRDHNITKLILEHQNKPTHPNKIFLPGATKLNNNKP